MSSLASFFSSFVGTVYADAEKPEPEENKNEEAEDSKEEEKEEEPEEEEEEEPEDVCFHWLSLGVFLCRAAQCDSLELMCRSVCVMVH